MLTNGYSEEIEIDLASLLTVFVIASTWFGLNSSYVWIYVAVFIFIFNSLQKIWQD